MPVMHARVVRMGVLDRLVDMSVRVPFLIVCAIRVAMLIDDAHRGRASVHAQWPNAGADVRDSSRTDRAHRQVPRRRIAATRYRWQWRLANAT
jgi:hypothetical protein